MYYVYILESTKNNCYYVGATNNIGSRIKKHNNNQRRYTKNKGPWVLKYKEEFVGLAEARKREKQIKSWKKRKAIERLVNIGPVV